MHRVDPAYPCRFIGIQLFCRQQKLGSLLCADGLYEPLATTLMKEAGCNFWSPELSIRASETHVHVCKVIITSTPSASVRFTDEDYGQVGEEVEVGIVSDAKIGGVDCGVGHVQMHIAA